MCENATAFIFLFKFLYFDINNNVVVPYEVFLLHKNLQTVRECFLI